MDKINESEKKLLSNYDLKFIPTPKLPKETTKIGLLQAAEKFSRNIKLKYFFRNSTQIKQPFTGASTWIPPENSIPEDIQNQLQEMTSSMDEMNMITETKNNFHPKLAKTLKILSKRTDIVIKSADKGSATVVQTRYNYLREGYKQLLNTHHYIEIPEPIFPKTSEIISKILLDLKNLNYISQRQLNYLLPPVNPRPRRFYLLPKIHKPLNKWTLPGLIPPGRPIVSDCNSESYKVSEFIDYHLQPLASSHPSYVKDTYDFLDKINKITVPPNALLITIDVDAMYTNIDNQAGINAIKQAFHESPDPFRPSKHLIDLLQISLESNDFQFNGDYFLQIHGTAMGKKFAPSYCNIFMAQWEKTLLNVSQCNPSLYLRYLDDIFMIWPHSHESFQNFFQIANNLHPSIKLKYEISEKTIDFLDVTIFKGSKFNETSNLDTKVYFKPTDTHQLLHKSSFHPKHTFQGVLKSQILRFKRICSSNEDFNEACSILFKALRTRGYSDRFLRSMKSKTLNPVAHKKIETAPASSSQSQSQPCRNPRCKTCIQVSKSNHFTNAEANKIYPIKGNMDCDSTNLIYLISCKKCPAQYVGETGNSLRTRFTQHRYNINKNVDTPVSTHFSETHNIEDLILTPIEKIPDTSNTLKDKSLRKLHETYWIKTLATYKNHGLNSLEQLNTGLIPFIIPFGTNVKNANSIMRKSYEELQNYYPEIFVSEPITAYSRNKNLKDYLVCSVLKK